MYNLLIALAAGLATLLLFVATGLVGWWGALLPALVVLGATYFFLARRTLRQLEALMMEAQRDLGAKRIDAGLEKMKQGFALSKWQFLVAGQVHAQIGMLLYVMKRFDEARPHLEKSFSRIGQARAMLGALHFQQKDYEGMKRVFEQAAAVNKKDGFLWSVYAWCLDKSGQRKEALEALSRGLAASPQDERLKANQLALQNNERMRMKAYGQEWWAFHLEQPPMDAFPPGMRPQPMQRKGYRNRPAR